MASNKTFVRVMVVLAMLVLLATPSNAGIIQCYKECKSGCEGKIKCIFTCVPTCLATGGGGADGALTYSDCKRRCFSSECIKFAEDEKKAFECMKSCDHSCEKKI